MKTNEHTIRILGSANIPEPLELDKRYQITLEADCYSIDERSNQNGSIDIVYKLKQTGVAEILSEGKTIIKAKEKGSMSKKLHGALWIQHNEQGLTEEFDEFYARHMKKLISYLPEIISFLDTKSE